MKIQLPFQGFYESIHSHELDNAFNLAFDYDGDGEPDIPEELQDDFWFETSFVEWGFFKAYAEAYNDALENEITYELDISLDFVELSSPKFYNYSTDVIISEISEADFIKLFNATNKDTLRKLIKDKLTPSSGFIPNYSNDLTDWLVKPLKEWDSIETSLVLQAWISDNLMERDLDYKLIDHINAYELIADLIPSEFYNKFSPQESEATS